MKNSYEILNNIFREYYKPELWLKERCKPNMLTNRFLISKDKIGNFIHVSRSIVNGCIKGCKYTIEDIIATKDNETTTYYRILTSEYNNINDAHQGFFYSLCGAEFLLSREDGTLNVGDVSYGLMNYICFVRNNTCIKIMALGEKICVETIHNLAINIDLQIIDKSSNNETSADVSF